MPKTGEIRREHLAADRDTQYVRVVVDDFETARDEFSPVLRRYGVLYNLYRGYQQGKLIPFRNNITIPLAFSMVQSYAAKLSNIELADPRLVSFIAVGPEDQRLARKRDATVNLQFYDANAVDKFQRLFVASAVFGTVAVETFWDVRKEMQRFRADFGEGETRFEYEETTFDGPNFELLDPRNFFVCPGYARINEGMPWAIKRFFLDIEDVNELAEAGVFNKRGTVDLGAPPSAGGKDEYLTTSGDPARLSLDGMQRRSRIDRPVEILLRWGRVPRALAVEGETNAIIVVANRKHLLRVATNPFGRIPVREFQPMPDPYYWHGPSIVEVASKLQIASNALASQKMDALQLVVDPQIFYNRRLVQPKRRMTVRPGAWHPVDGEVTESNIRAFFPDMRGLTTAYQETEQLAHWMEQATGIVRDAIQGMTGPDRETARGFLGRKEGAEVRLLLAARCFEHQVVEPLAMDFVRLNREFLTFPHQLRMLGAAAVLDPVTLQPVPSETDMLEVNDMLPDYEARGLGALRGASSMEEAQMLMQFQQTVQTNPIGIQLINWFAFFRMMLAKLKVANVDEMMNTEGVIAQAVANAMGVMQQQAAGQPGQPTVAPTQAAPPAPVIPEGAPV